MAGLGTVYEATIHGSNIAVPLQVVGHWVVVNSIGPEAGEIPAFAQALLETLIYKTIVNDSLDFMTTFSSWQRVVIRDVDDPSAGGEFIIPAGDGGGKLTGDRNATRLAVLAKKVTAKVGRSFSGRNYWPFLTEEQLSGGKIDIPSQTNILDWLTIMTGLVSTGALYAFSQVVYSRKLGVATLVSDVGVRELISSQIRRG